MFRTTVLVHLSGIFLHFLLFYWFKIYSPALGIDNSYTVKNLTN